MTVNSMKDSIVSKDSISVTNTQETETSYIENQSQCEINTTIHDLSDTEDYLNVERMRVALDAESFTMPKGLTREQKRQFIIGSAASITSEGYTSNKETEDTMKAELNRVDFSDDLSETESNVESEELSIKSNHAVPHLSDLMGEYEDELAKTNEDFSNQFKNDYEETVGRISDNCDNIEKAAMSNIYALYESKGIFTRDTVVDEDVEFTQKEALQLKTSRNILHNIMMYKSQEGLLEYLTTGEGKSIVKEVAVNPAFLEREYNKFKSFKRKNKLFNSLNFESAINICYMNTDKENFRHYTAFCYCLLRYLNSMRKEGILENNLIYATFTSATSNASIYRPRPFYSDLFEKLESLRQSEKPKYKIKEPTVKPPTIKNAKKKSTKRNKKYKR